MTVGVVVVEASIEPDDLVRAKGIPEGSLRFIFSPAVAVLIEHGPPRREDRTLSVVLHCATFKNEVELADRRACKPGDVVADRGVVGQVELAAPAIGAESERDC